MIIAVLTRMRELMPTLKQQLQWTLLKIHLAGWTTSGRMHESTDLE